MAALIVSEENCQLLDKVQSTADNMWKENRNRIAGVKGAKSIRHLSALNSHPEFPIFAVALATMPAMGNGITVNLWGEEEPLSMTCFNVNYSQTRKSRLGKISEKMNRSVDGHIRTVLEKILAAKERHQYNTKQKALRDREKERRKSEPASTASDCQNAAASGELSTDTPVIAVDTVGTDDDQPINAQMNRVVYWDRFALPGSTDSSFHRSASADTLMPRAETQVVNNAGAVPSHMYDLHDGRLCCMHGIAYV